MIGRRHLIGTLSAALAIAFAGMALLIGTPASSQRTDQDADVVVFAPASLKNALDAVNEEWRRETGKIAVISYAASSALAKQIENGAPAKLFISADLEWMDYLDKKGLIDPSSRSDLLGNQLVLIAPQTSAKAIDIKPNFDIANVVGDGKLAVGLVDSVPAGKYAKAALTKLGVWGAVENHLAQAENVRAALALVSRGEAVAGIVYKTDAAAEKGVTIIGTFPEDSHPAIVYPIALTTGAGDPGAAVLLAFIKSEKAKPIFEAQGFKVLH